MVFTGLIQAIGYAKYDKNFILHVRCSPEFWRHCKKGDSIAVNGVCLTLLEETNGSDTATFFAMEETRNKTNFNSSLWATEEEKVVNLELSLKVGDHLGGHTTSGHVDGTGRVASVLPHPDGSQCLWIDLSSALSKEDISKHVIYKGSICLDGVSLTVAEIKEQQIRVSLIPHTLSHTNLQYRKIGDIINIEFDQALKLLQAPAATEVKRSLFELTDWELKLKDEEFMLKAIELGERGRLTSAPNPWVGCVIVTEHGDIIGRGFHAKAGEGHAEANAVRDAKESGNEHLLKNSIVYSTLEPCHPFEGKRTPPCDHLLVECGVKRVVIALVDEDKNVGNKGIEYLKSHGLEVVVGICHEQAFNSLRPYLHHRRTGKPLVVAKIASSIDGKVGCEDYTSQWITGENARSHAHSTWRGTVGHAGAVLVGAGTAIKDRPRLTVRSAQTSTSNTNEQREVKQPLRIVIDGRGSVNDPTTPLLAQGGPDGEARTLIATTEAADPKSLEVWRNAGIDIWISKNSRNEGKIDLDELLLDLGRRGIMHVLIEGGPTVLGQFLEKNLVDRVVLYVGACLIGGSGISWTSVTLATTIKDAQFWKLNECKVLGNDVCMVYDKQDQQ